VKCNQCNNFSEPLVHGSALSRLSRCGPGPGFRGSTRIHCVRSCWKLWPVWEAWLGTFRIHALWRIPDGIVVVTTSRARCSCSRSPRTPCSSPPSGAVFTQVWRPFPPVSSAGYLGARWASPSGGPFLARSRFPPAGLAGTRTRNALATLLVDPARSCCRCASSRSPSLSSL
jgi:hypothetical protein